MLNDEISALTLVNADEEIGFFPISFKSNIDGEFMKISECIVLCSNESHFFELDGNCDATSSETGRLISLEPSILTSDINEFVLIRSPLETLKPSILFKDLK